MLDALKTPNASKHHATTTSSSKGELEKARLREAGRRKLEEWRAMRRYVASSGTPVSTAAVPVLQNSCPGTPCHNLSAAKGLASLSMHPMTDSTDASLHRYDDYNPSKLGPGTSYGSVCSPPSNSSPATTIPATPGTLTPTTPAAPSPLLSAHRAAIPPEHSPTASRSAPSQPVPVPEGPSQSSTAHGNNSVQQQQPQQPLERAASSDKHQDPLVEMLLMQVDTLMRDKAALQAHYEAVRRENEQLHELVGYLMCCPPGGEEPPTSPTAHDDATTSYISTAGGGSSTNNGSSTSFLLPSFEAGEGQLPPGAEPEHPQDSMMLRARGEEDIGVAPGDMAHSTASDMAAAAAAGDGSLTGSRAETLGVACGAWTLLGERQAPEVPALTDLVSSVGAAVDMSRHTAAMSAHGPAVSSEE
eukprot:CAMPEP_0202909242 /NCGR_PEP_ID=MMETSP1392-20130828/48761_1 /ASSEMBLY_ACC=CAM_ASM_000868 /TAXON_ID=225041 /ORGANISM="Chlamydomonas chlamydogama, Strain SAG 11-48b" /LENGTH=415 /DNA_ID=CAMNT_0049598929 /DNA_START=59 /DNA_END=1303 /DNA_ORIENTATION=+